MGRAKQDYRGKGLEIAWKVKLEYFVYGFIVGITAILWLLLEGPKYL